MKKFKVLPLLAIIPMVTSCNGFYITDGEALVILKNISDKLEDNRNDYHKFTYTHKIKEGDETTEIQVICDRDARFYYSYRIKGIHIDEYWRYQKEDKLYICYRENGATKDGNPDVTAVTKDFTNEEWVEVEKEIFDGEGGVIDYGIDKTLNSHVLKMKEIALASSSNAKFSSWNASSVTCEYSAENVSYRADIVDDKLTWVTYSEGDNKTENFNINYERAHINYLNF